MVYASSERVGVQDSIRCEDKLSACQDCDNKRGFYPGDIMSLSDCSECWDTPCTCGFEYKDYTDDEIIEWLRDILKFHPNLIMTIKKKVI